jgi:hypothetical protein
MSFRPLPITLLSDASFSNVNSTRLGKFHEKQAVWARSARPNRLFFRGEFENFAKS